MDVDWSQQEQLEIQQRTTDIMAQRQDNLRTFHERVFLRQELNKVALVANGQITVHPNFKSAEDYAEQHFSDWSTLLFLPIVREGKHPKPYTVASKSRQSFNTGTCLIPMF